MKRIVAAILLLGSFQGVAQAGPFTDEMAKCLVKKTTEADKTLLIKWVYAAMSAHPDVAALSNISPAKAEELNQAAGDMFTDLVAVRCQKETADAMKYEGSSAFEASFEVLGKVAMQGLMSHPGVSEYLGGLAKHIDEKKLNQAFGTGKK